MIIRKIADLIEGEVIIGHEYLERDVKAAFGSDLMSDVLAYVSDETVLLTGLTNHQVVRTAEMLDLKAIIFVRGKYPSEDVVTLAKEHKIVLIATKHTLYTASGILYCNGLQGISK